MVFRWDSRDEVEPGDQWIWQEVGEPGFERTRRRTLTVRSSEQVCLEVRQVRGTQESPTANECVP